MKAEVKRSQHDPLLRKLLYRVAEFDRMKAMAELRIELREERQALAEKGLLRPLAYRPPGSSSKLSEETSLQLVNCVALCIEKSVRIVLRTVAVIVWFCAVRQMTLLSITCALTIRTCIVTALSSICVMAGWVWLIVAIKSR
nr:hypothetical protein pPsy0462b_00024 [Pseudomonas syringae]